MAYLGSVACVWKHPKSRFWFARFRDASNRRVNRSTGTANRREATLLAEQWERAARNARNRTLTRERAKEVLDEILAQVNIDPIPSASIEDVFAGWLADVESEATRARYSVVKGKFLDHLGPRSKVPAVEISSSDVQSFITSRARDREAKTAQNDLRCLSAAFNRAVRLGLLDRNPCLAVRPPEGRAVERKPFSADQVALLLDAAPSEEWRLLLRIMWFTALRLGDASTLEWAEVDLARAAIVRRQAKTGSDVVVPIHPELLAALEAAAGDADGPVLPELSKVRPGGKNGLSAQFGAIVAAAGIDPERHTTKSGRSFARLTGHSMRHGATAALAAADVPQDVRTKITGHSDVATHQKYSHHGVESLRAAVAKIPGTGRPPKPD